MDTALLRRYVGALSDAGLTGKLAILVGINPLRSAKSAQWMKSHLFGTVIPDDLIARMEKASDPVREGIRICVDLIAELATIPGIAGVHIMAPGNDAAIPEVIAEAKSRVQKAAVTSALSDTRSFPRRRESRLHKLPRSSEDLGPRLRGDERCCT